MVLLWSNIHQLGGHSVYKQGWLQSVLLLHNDTQVHILGGDTGHTHAGWGCREFAFCIFPSQTVLPPGPQGSLRRPGTKWSEPSIQGQTGECSVLLHVFLLGFLVEETPCEHGENMQTPHRKTREIAVIKCILWSPTTTVHQTLAEDTHSSARLLSDLLFWEGLAMAKLPQADVEFSAGLLISVPCFLVSAVPHAFWCSMKKDPSAHCLLLKNQHSCTIPLPPKKKKKPSTSRHPNKLKWD